MERKTTMNRRVGSDRRRSSAGVRNFAFGRTPSKLAVRATPPFFAFWRGKIRFLLQLLVLFTSAGLTQADVSPSVRERIAGFTAERMEAEVLYLEDKMSSDLFAMGLNYDLTVRAHKAVLDAATDDQFLKFLKRKGLDPEAEADRPRLKAVIFRYVVEYWQSSRKAEPELGIWLTTLEGISDGAPLRDAMARYKELQKYRPQDFYPKILLLQRTNVTTRQDWSDWVSVVEDAYGCATNTQQRVLCLKLCWLRLMPEAIKWALLQGNLEPLTELSRWVNELREDPVVDEGRLQWPTKCIQVCLAMAQKDFSRAAELAEGTPFQSMIPLWLIPAGKLGLARKLTAELHAKTGLTDADKRTLKLLDEMLEQLHDIDNDSAIEAMESYRKSDKIPILSNEGSEGPSAALTFQFTVDIVVLPAESEELGYGSTKLYVVAEGQRVACLITSPDGLPFGYMTHGIWVAADDRRPGGLMCFEGGNMTLDMGGTSNGTRFAFKFGYSRESEKPEVMLHAAMAFNPELSTKKPTFDSKSRELVVFRDDSKITVQLVAENDPEPFGIAKLMVDNAKSGRKLVCSNVRLNSRPQRNILGIGRADFEKLGLPVRVVTEWNPGTRPLVRRDFPKNELERKAADRLRTLFRE